MSTAFRWFVTATAMTEISSAALRPTIAPPSTTPVAGSERIFTKPRVSPLISAFGFAENGHLGDPELAARRERLGLGHADLGDLGVGEDGLRGLVVVEVAVGPRGESHHVLGDLAALHRRDRRQRQTSGDVARGVDVRQVRLAVTVAGDVAVLVDLDARGLAPEALGVGHRADAQQGVRSVDGPTVVAGDEDLVVVATHRDRARALQQLDAPAQELVFQHRRNLGVLVGQHLLAGHDQRDLRPERAEHVRELHAGHTRSDHDEMVGDLGRRVRLAGRQDPFAVDRREVGDARPRPGRQQDRVGFELLGTVLGVGRDGVRAGEPAAYPARGERPATRAGSSLRCGASPPCPRSACAARRRRGSPRLRGPSSARGPARPSALPVATIALLGMQSQRCAAPPTMSRSIIVTSAPIDAATVAAVLPAGPPPMITNRTAMLPGYAPWAAYPDPSMQQLLVDGLTGDQVILAPARALRPDTFRVQSEPVPASVPDLSVLRRQRARDPARGRALRPGRAGHAGLDGARRPQQVPARGRRRARRARGRDLLPRARRRPEPRCRPTRQPTCWSRCVTACASISRRAASTRQAFVNQGKAAGASIEHPHAQLVALDLVPARARVRLDHFTPSAFADDQEHLVADGAVRVWCPRAAATPYTLRLAPADGGARFDEASDEQTRATGVALRDAIARLRTIIGRRGLQRHDRDRARVTTALRSAGGSTSCPA